jgi:hypothetical protein
VQGRREALRKQRSGERKEGGSRDWGERKLRFTEEISHRESQRTEASTPATRNV